MLITQSPSAPVSFQHGSLCGLIALPFLEEQLGCLNPPAWPSQEHITRMNPSVPQQAFSKDLPDVSFRSNWGESNDRTSSLPRNAYVLSKK